MASKKSKSAPRHHDSGYDKNDSNDAGVVLVQLDASYPIQHIPKASPLEEISSERRPSKRVRPTLNSPWTLHFERDGTEDFAIICDSNGNDLASSRFFWLPEDEDDEIPPTLAGMWAMACAPELLRSLREMVAFTLSLGQPAPGSKDAKRIAKARAAIAKATGKSFSA